MLCEKQNLSLPRNKGQRVSRGQCGEKSKLIHKPLIILVLKLLVKTGFLELFDS